MREKAFSSMLVDCLEVYCSEVFFTTRPQQKSIPPIVFLGLNPPYQASFVRDLLNRYPVGLLR